jgi:subtilisin family serine protease
MSKRHLILIAGFSVLVFGFVLLRMCGGKAWDSVKRRGMFSVPETVAGAGAGVMTSVSADNQNASNAVASDAVSSAAGSARDILEVTALKDRYSGIKSIEQRTGAEDRRGITTRARLIRGSSKYPLLRIEDHYKTDPAGGEELLVSQLVMVGDHVMVRLHEGYTSEDIELFVKRNGFLIRKNMKSPGCYLVSVKAATLDSVANLTNSLASAACVDIAEPDYVVTVSDTTPNDPSYSSLWGMSKIEMPKVWDMSVGSGEEVVAVFDTGTDLDHEDLVNNLWQNTAEIPGNGIDDDDNGYVDDVYGWDFYAEDNDPNDVYGHGSHVAGTIGAEGGNAVGVAGVNWNIKIMTIKFFGRNASGVLEGFASDAADGMYYVITQKKRGIPVRVTNHSWGGSGFSYIFRDAMEAAAGQDIMHVVAAGNDGSLNNDTDPQYPASYNLDSILAIANTTQSDGLNASSHYGATSVDIGAPGTSIYSISMGGGYKYMSGTSMSSPHVAGVAALMFGYMPELSRQQVRQAIIAGVDPLPALSGKCVTGGRLNAYGAFEEVGPYIEHEPLDNTTDVYSDHIVEAFIRPSLPIIDTNNVLVLWNSTGDTNSFYTNIMQHVSNDLFRAAIPAQSEGTVIYYMIKAVTKTGRMATDPADAPAALHRFDVTYPVDMLVFGDPGEYGTVDPEYGDQTTAWGSTVTALASLYAEETDTHRYRCIGWLGGGNVPSTGTSNSVSFLVSENSAIMWQWIGQYSLSQTSSLPDNVVDSVTWWNESSLAETVTAPGTAMINGTNYAFVCWHIDGLRFPDATNTAVNPAANLTMSSARQAEAFYMPADQDSDSDGISDWWEMFNFATLSYGSTNDPDGDGYSNQAEFADSSNPRDASSVPQGPQIEHTPLEDPMGRLSPWQVSATVTDAAGVASVRLSWRRNAESWSNASMTVISGDIYSAEIPSPHIIGDSFTYYIQAVDNAANTNETIDNIFHVAYPLILTIPQSLSLTLVSPAADSVSLIVTNRGNADLTWQLRTNWSDSVSADEGGWTHSGENSYDDTWHISSQESSSGLYAWYCGDDMQETYANAMDARLLSPAVTLGASPSFSFRQWMRSEYDGRSGFEEYFWDGAVVDISTNDGTSFERIVPVGGYPYKITPNDDSPFSYHTPCLAGTGGWETVSFDLDQYAGKTVKIRFRFGSDMYSVERGWFIDDILFSWESSWLTLGISSGIVAESSSVILPVGMNSAGLALGEYNNTISLICNDPTRPELSVPVTLYVVAADDRVHIAMDENNPNAFIISWQSDTSNKYSLVANTNLNNDSWAGVPGYTNMPGINGIMHYTGDVSGVSSKFYKVDEEPL